MVKLYTFCIAFILSWCIIIVYMLPPWGLLPKTQDNPQTIDEAIASAISAHEADPTAHLGTGESLEQHKNNQMIDHPALSIPPDKFNSANNFFDLNVNGDITGLADNYSSLFAGWLASMGQNSPLTGDATLNLFNYDFTDFQYTGGDIVCDFIIVAFGSSGSWSANFSTGFAKVELKQDNIRFGYYNGSWNYSSWVSFDSGSKHKFRIHFDSVNGRLIFYINGLSAYDIAYSISAPDSQFNLVFTLNRGSSSSSSFGFGNIKLGFDSAD